MTTTTILASHFAEVQGRCTTSDCTAVYEHAREGTHYTAVVADGTSVHTGQNYSTGTYTGYTCAEGLIEFDTSIIGSNRVITAVTLEIYYISWTYYHQPYAGGDTFEVRDYNFGDTISYTDYMKGSELEGYTLLGSLSGTIPVGYNAFTSETDFLTAVNMGTGNVRLLINSLRERIDTAPTGVEWAIWAGTLWSAEYHPRLIITHEPVPPAAYIETAVTAPARTISAGVSVDWDGDGHGGAGTIDNLTSGDAPTGKVTKVTVERMVTGTLPDDVQVTEGLSAATAKCELAGPSSTEALNTVRYWSIFNPNSPIYGKPRVGRSVNISVDFQTEIGWQSVPLITNGVLNGIPVSVAEQSATMDVIDARDRFRRRVALPAMLADPPALGGGFSLGQNLGKPGLEASWIASYVLYQAGYYMAPPARETCTLYIPFHGSAQPFIQRDYAGTAGFWQSTENDYVCTFTDGPYFLGIDPYGHQELTADPISTAGYAQMRDGATHMFANNGHSSGRVEVWVKPPSSGLTSAVFYAMFEPDWDISTGEHTAIIKLDHDGSTSLELTNGSGITVTATGPTYSFDGSWHLFGCHWTDSTGRVIFSWDHTETLETFTPTATGSYGDSPNTIAFAQSYTYMSELHVDVGIAEDADWQPLTYTPTVVIDRLQNRRLTGIWPEDGRQVWEILQELTAAELGLTHVDADGILQVWSRARLASSAGLTAQRTVTSRTAITDLNYDDHPSQVRNVIRCKYTGLTTLGSADFWSADPIGLWGIDSTEGIAPGQTRTWDIELSAPLAGPIAVNGYTCDGTSAGSGGMTQHTIVYNYCSVPMRITTTVLEQTPKDNDTRVLVRLTITNLYTCWQWFVNLAGTPSLQLDGATIKKTVACTHEARDDAAISTAGVELPLDLPDNRWYQTGNFARGVCDGLLAELKDTNPYVITDLRIVGDPRLALWDRIGVQDTDATMLNTEVLIDGITTTVDVGCEQSLVVRPARNLWVIGGTGVGTGLGTTIMGSGT